MKNKAGFTLIELIVVIVILGIIAVVAAPRFLNLQIDARNSALSGLAASIEAAGNIVFTKAVLQGKETAISDTIQIGNETVELVYGYPAPSYSNLAKIVDGLGGSNSQWKECRVGGTTDGCITFASEPDTNHKTDCFVMYFPLVYKPNNTIHSQNNVRVAECK